MGRISGWIIDKAFVTCMLVIAVFIFIATSFLPYIGQFIAEGMPYPSGKVVGISNVFKLNDLGSCVQGKMMGLCVTDAFVCNSYMHVPYTILSSGENKVASSGYEYVFLGIKADWIGGDNIALPEAKDVILFCGEKSAKGALPTSGEPFLVPGLKERSRWWFFSFADDPYGFSLGGCPRMQNSQN